MPIIRVLLSAALVIFSTLPAFAFQTQPTPKPQNSGMGSSSNGLNPANPTAADGGSSQRQTPVTAGGLIESGPKIFEDVSHAAGLSVWNHRMGTAEKKLILETNGSGAGLIDYDNDGWLDIYLVNGSTFAALDGKEPTPHAALFHNNHDGTFTDVAAKAGVQNDRWGFGVAIADFDNDGWADIFVCNWGKNRLYRNNHDGTFTDVAEKAGVTLGNWSAGATWGDYDGDGNPDLFVAGYVHFDRDNLPYSKTKATGFNACEFRGTPVMCGPQNLEGEPDHLFHNNGDGTFTDVSVKAGVGDITNRYYGLTPIFADMNNDGRPDLLVADDSTLSYLYINKGDGTFEDASFTSGFALNSDGRAVAAMGVAVGDYLNNGLLDVAITDFSNEAKLLYRNDGGGSFSEVGMSAGVGLKSMPFLGWGTGFLDYDNDGWLDLLMINGHIYPVADTQEWGTSYKERPQLFHNLGEGKFEEVAPVKGTGLAEVIPGRGAAFGDLFNNGKVDVIINPEDGAPILLKNTNPDHHHWVELNLEAIRPGQGHDAVGTTVYLKANGMRHREEVMSSGSYVSTNDPRPHFGLGDSTDPGSAEIRWPNGAKETVKLPGVDRIYTIHQGKGIIGSLCNGAPCESSGSSVSR